MIRAEDLWKKFGRHEALRGLSFSVPEGSAYALIGANGAGKTTRLSGQVDRKVVDKTGMAGRFTFHLEFAPDAALRGGPGRGGDAGNPDPPGDPAGPTIFAALQEQLGLKLAPEKGPVEFLVIDHVEKPTQN